MGETSIFRNFINVQQTRFPTFCLPFVGGTVRDHRRRYINKSSGEQVEIITSTLTGSNNRNFYVEDYAPSSYRNISDQTVVPVHIKPYRKSNGLLSYTICITKGFETRSESF